jgi:hypothetical protein
MTRTAGDPRSNWIKFCRVHLLQATDITSGQLSNPFHTVTSTTFDQNEHFTAATLAVSNEI